MYVLRCGVVVLTVLELACVRTLFTDPASSAVWRCCACCVTCAGEAKCEALSAKSVAPLHAGGFWCVAGHTRSVVVSRVYHASALTPSGSFPCVCVCGCHLPGRHLFVGQDYSGSSRPSSTYGASSDALLSGHPALTSQGSSRNLLLRRTNSGRSGRPPMAPGSLDLDASLFAAASAAPLPSPLSGPHTPKVSSVLQCCAAAGERSWGSLVGGCRPGSRHGRRGHVSVAQQDTTRRTHD